MAKAHVKWNVQFLKDEVLDPETTTWSPEFKHEWVSSTKLFDPKRKVVERPIAKSTLLRLLGDWVKDGKPTQAAIDTGRAKLFWNIQAPKKKTITI